MSVLYRNRYGDVYSFTKQENGDILMEGDFNYVRTGKNFVDPSGGPYLEIGQMLGHVVHGDNFNIIIEGFTNSEKGMVIHTKPNTVHPNRFTHLEDRDIIGGII